MAQKQQEASSPIIIEKIKYYPNKAGNVELILYKDPDSGAKRIFIVTIGKIEPGEELCWTKQSYHLHQYLQQRKEKNLKTSNQI